MPNAAPRPCGQPGCSTLVRDGTGRCPAHKKPAPGSFADPARGSRHERGYGTDWVKRRERIRQRDFDLCQECRRQGRLKEVGDKPYSAYVDHIIPKFEGGTDDDSNLETLCRTCHTEKTNREKNRGRGVQISAA